MSSTFRSRAADRTCGRGARRLARLAGLALAVITSYSIHYTKLYELRGGSSKGLYFKAADLPDDQDTRDRVLLAAMCGVGPEDKRQIDGLGGSDPLTSKVGIVSPSSREDADLDYVITSYSIHYTKLYD